MYSQASVILSTIAAEGGLPGQRGGTPRQTPPPPPGRQIPPTVNRRSVRFLLECILVLSLGYWSTIMKKIEIMKVILMLCDGKYRCKHVRNNQSFIHIKKSCLSEGFLIVFSICFELMNVDNFFNY